MAGIAAISDKGTFRSTNEDACCVQVASTPFGEVVMGVVCDGVGGLSQGEVASATVVRRFALWFETTFPSLLAMMGEGFAMLWVIEEWERLLADCNGALRRYGMKSDTTVATTFTGVLTCGGHYVVGQVGDSRLYRMGSVSCEQVTQDQSYVAELLARGEICADEVREHPLHNVITQAVGARNSLRPVFTTGSYTAEDLFVLCTDGVYRTSGADGVASVFRTCDRDEEDSLLDACDELIARAIGAGERDNLTIACFVPQTPDREPVGTHALKGSLA